MDRESEHAKCVQKRDFYAVISVVCLLALAAMLNFLKDTVTRDVLMVAAVGLLAVSTRMLSTISRKLDKKTFSLAQLSILLGVVVLIGGAVFLIPRRYQYYCTGSTVFVVERNPLLHMEIWHCVDGQGNDNTTSTAMFGGLFHRPSVNMDIPRFRDPYRWAPPFESIQKSFLSSYRAQGHVGFSLLSRYGAVSNEAEVIEIAKKESTNYCSYHDVITMRKARPAQPSVGE